NTSEDRVTGLKKGADDYLVKPFNLEELILRVGILVRRSLSGEELKELTTYKIGDKTIDFKSFELRQDDSVIAALTKKETMLLKLLIERRGDAVPTGQTLDAIWHSAVYPRTRLSHI